MYAIWKDKHLLTINAGSEGNPGFTVDTNRVYLADGQSHTLPDATGWDNNTSEDNYFKEWSIGGTGTITDGAITIQSDVTITAVWGTKYFVTGTMSSATVKINEVSVNAKENYWYKPGTSLTFAVSYDGSSSKTFSYSMGSTTGLTATSVIITGDITFNASSTSGGSCVAKGTIITLADGTQKAVEDLTGEEELLVWNLLTGSYDTAKIVFVDVDAETEYEIIHLYFSDGTDVEVIYEHGFFDVGLGEYVYIDSDNANSFVGHTFIKQGDLEQGTWETVTLDRVVIERKVTVAYSPVTFEHLCYYVDGMLSMPGGIDGLFNIFAVDVQTMSYDSELMAEDIAEHGLFSYEDFGGLIPEDAFYAFNGAYLKVAIGKGMITWEMIAYLAERYVPLM